MSGSLKVSRGMQSDPSKEGCILRRIGTVRWYWQLSASWSRIMDGRLPKWVAAFDRNRWLLSVQTRLTKIA